MFFTLLEMLLALGIASGLLCSGAFSLHKALQKERFHGSIAQLEARVRLARELAQWEQQLAILTLEKKEKGLSCTMQFAKPLPFPWEQELGKELFLPEVERVFFNGHSQDTVSLCFSGGVGSLTPAELLIESSSHLKQALLLSRYPSSSLPVTFPREAKEQKEEM